MFVALPQRTFHGVDTDWFALLLDAGDVFRQPTHIGYLPLCWLVLEAMKPFGAGAVQAMLMASALGSALGVFFLHRAALRLAPRDATLVPIAVALTPACCYFATAAEIPGVFAAASGAAWWAFARWRDDARLGSRWWSVPCAASPRWCTRSVTCCRRRSCWSWRCGAACRQSTSLPPTRRSPLPMPPSRWRSRRRSATPRAAAAVAAALSLALVAPRWAPRYRPEFVAAAAQLKSERGVFFVVGPNDLEGMRTHLGGTVCAEIERSIASYFAMREVDPGTPPLPVWFDAMVVVMSGPQRACLVTTEAQQWLSTAPSPEARSLWADHVRSTYELEPLRRPGLEGVFLRRR